MAFLPLALLGLGWTACAAPGSNSAAADAQGSPVSPITHRVEILSDPYVIEEVFDSMHGPGQRTSVVLPESHQAELLWLQAIRNEAITADVGEPLSQEFLCHANLAFSVDPQQLQRDTELFRATENLEPRIFTLIQGQNTLELPAGFGFPVLSAERLEFDSMVINKNVTELPFSLRVKTTLEYLRDSELVQAPKPLFRRRLFNFVEVKATESKHQGMDHGPNGATAMEDGMSVQAEQASGIVGRDAQGREYTFHWIVAPGRHEYRSRVRSQLRLPFDTTLHYVTTHLHPYGESVRLVDLTTGETLVQLDAHMYEDRIGVREMESFKSGEGVALYRDHDYELITVYDNTTDEEIDAMAIMYLYMMDHGFERPPFADPSSAL